MAYGRLLAGAGALMLACLSAGRALAWSDEGHEVVAIIAKTYLAANSPATLSRVEALLASDASKLTAHDIGAEAIWADKFRDSDRDTTKVNYGQTHNWHYININVADPAPDEPSSRRDGRLRWAIQQTAWSTRSSSSKTNCPVRRHRRRNASWR